MHIVAGRQLRHRRFLAKRLQRDRRLQLSRITPSLPVAFQTPSPWSGSHLSKLSKFRDPPLVEEPRTPTASRLHRARTGRARVADRLSWSIAPRACHASPSAERSLRGEVQTVEGARAVASEGIFRTATPCRNVFFSPRLRAPARGPRHRFTTAAAVVL